MAFALAKSLLGLFVQFVRLAPLAKLFELQTVLELFFVLMRIIVNAVALTAFEFDQIVL